MRTFSFLLLISLAVLAARGQATHPVSWTLSSEDIGNGTFKIYLRATIREPFHIYPQQSSDGGLGIPTSIVFRENANIELVGEPEEKGLEENNSRKMAYYSKGVLFTQTVKLRTDKATMVDVKVRYMACTHEMCLPPAARQFTLMLNDKGGEAETVTYEDFSMSDTAGKIISSKDIISRSKYTFIDFWASWCVPCRAQGRELQPLYEKYRSGGFSVIGVSLDTDASAWKKAITADGYTWTNVSDLKGFESPLTEKYRITGVPRNFLLDERGVIVATDLHGRELAAKLEELMSR